MSDMSITPGNLRRPPRKRQEIGPGRGKISSNSKTVNEDVDDV